MTAHCVLGLGRFGFFNFGSIRFGFQSQVLGFFGFSIRAPPRWSADILRRKLSIEVYRLCLSVFTHQFSSKYIGRPC